MSGVKRARTTRTGTGSSSQEQEVADPMMTLERRMEYLRGRPVAKERPVTLSDFDQLLAPEVQLEVRGVQFLFSADVIADFLNCPRPESPCFPAVPLNDEQRTSEQDLWTLMTGKTSAVDHFDLDYTRHEDVRTVVETMMTARRTHRNRMHAYFKKFPSKEAALLKPHPDTTEEQWKELCDLFTSEAFMKRSEQNKKNRSKLTVNHAAGSRSFQRTRACMKNQESGNINPAELYKKNYTNKDGIWTSEGAREIYERMDAFQRQCDLEGKTYTEIEHQLAKARDEIEAMRAAREKDLQEFAKKQAEMEATLRDHREEQRVEQERIRLEQEERMKREQERMRVSTRSACNRNKSACERSKSAYGQKYRRNWRRKCPL
ncbi:hypothetical protein CJ030_MR5G025014 [Morella rubra]|uniref:Uncharacterized protein n=1 Tax=Morella rubra TaxID=262757 RepID=A0A6A1VK88_9ROSI|nr:hypothetical protein CJ030_MR5G025014 [Morella rubra]